MMREPRKLPKLTPDWGKLLEVVLFLIEEAQRTGEPVTQYQIVKSMFIADERHLNEYGRPVVFCNYSAMENGPVSTEAFDMLKPTFCWLRLGFEAAPWARTPAPQISPKAFQFTNVARAANMRDLSETDIEHLRQALADVRALGFGGVKDYTHKHPAYQDAWVDGSDKKSFPMNYGLLINSKDDELLSDIIHASKYTVKICMQ